MRRQRDWPDFRMLLDWLDGRLDTDTAERVAAYVAEGDERTRRTVDWLRGFLRTAEALPLHRPPPIVRQNLNEYFARWSRARSELGEAPREDRVRLVFDSRRNLALTSVRAGTSGDEALPSVYNAGEDGLLIGAYGLGAARSGSMAGAFG